MTLSHAFLKKANLTDSDLSDADRRNAYREGANLTGANLNGVRMLGNEYFVRRAGLRHGNEADPALAGLRGRAIAVGVPPVAGAETGVFGLSANHGCRRIGSPRIGVCKPLATTRGRCASANGGKAEGTEAGPERPARPG